VVAADRRAGTELAHDGDPEALECVAGREALRLGIANLVNIFNPEVVVVGGGVIAAGELLLDPAREVMSARALSPSKDVVRIESARFGAEVGDARRRGAAFEGVVPHDYGSFLARRHCCPPAKRSR